MKEFMIKLAKDAGSIALQMMGKVKITAKGARDNVTEADKAVERLIISRIRESYPGHHIITEESGDLKAKSDSVWYIDPIDGTHNYSHSDMHFCVSIAMSEKGAMKYGCVYLPAVDRLYFAEKGKGAEMNGKKIRVSKITDVDKALVSIGLRHTGERLEESFSLFRYFADNADRVRDYGFCAAELCFAAEGSTDGIIKISQHIWDIAAGILMIEEAGGLVTDFKGNRLDISKIEGHDVIAANRGLHGKLIEEVHKGGKLK